jgi:SPP1 gp7 family putative phage head morphogenesis protein
LAARRKRKLGRAPRPAPAHVRRRRAPDVLPLVAPVEAAIGAEFDRLIAQVMAEIDDLLIARGVRRDAVSIRELFRTLKNTQNPRAILERLFGQVDREQAQALREQLPTVPIAAVVSNGARLKEQWVARNTDLIRAEAPVRRAVERVLSQPLDEGVRVEEIRKQLQERLGIEKRRAQLIARDQTLKLAGQLAEARQTQAGIRRYVWTTSADERVRPDHADLDGRTFEWAEPPIVDKRTGRRGHPGEDFQCRCTADPVLDDLEPEETEPRPVGESPPDPIEAQRELEAQRQAEFERQQRELERQREEELRRLEEARREQERRLAEERARAEQLQAEQRAQAEAARIAAAEQAPRQAIENIVPHFEVEKSPIGNAALDALEKAGIRKLFKPGELAELEILKKPIEVNGREVGGVFRQETGTALPVGHPNRKGNALRVDLSPGMLEEFTDANPLPLGHADLWAVANAQLDDVARVQSLVVHEFGHAVHRYDQFTALGQMVDRAIFEAGRSDPGTQQRDFISQYATTNSAEYFAEAFSAYHTNREDLRRKAPRAFAMVEKVLRLRGML